MHPECRILLMPGHVLRQPQSNCVGMPASDFPLLQKPVHPTEVLRHIAQHLNKGAAAKHAFPAVP